MYNPSQSYEENYEKGPSSDWGSFPKILFRDEPRYRFLGEPLYLPFGIPAGPLLNSKYMNAVIKAGFCVPTYKTVRRISYSSHPLPNILQVNAEKQIYARNENTLEAIPLLRKPENISITNSFGVPSKTPAIWAEDFQQVKKKPGFLPILSFQGTQGDLNSFFESTIETARLASQSSSFLEINLSCPNEAGEPIYKNVGMSAELIQAVCQAIGKKLKLVAKVGPMSTAEAQMFLKNTRGYLNAVSAINTVQAEVRSPNGEYALGDARPRAGVCGASILEQGIQTISAFAAARNALSLTHEEMPLIGVGGVFEPSHVRRYLSVGADIVQAATGAMWNLKLAGLVANELGVNFVEVS